MSLANPRGNGGALLSTWSGLEQQDCSTLLHGLRAAGHLLLTTQELRTSGRGRSLAHLVQTQRETARKKETLYAWRPVMGKSMYSIIIIIIVISNHQRTMQLPTQPRHVNRDQCIWKCFGPIIPRDGSSDPLGSTQPGGLRKKAGEGADPALA
jgi:hypothetical protein